MILGIIASSISGSKVVTNDYESIATTTVGSGGTANVTFSSIASTWSHLQLRCISRNAYTGGSAGIDNLFIQFNSDTASNYSAHYLSGNGASASAGAYNADVVYCVTSTGGTGTQPFSVQVIDILDYKDTNKYKTVRLLSGADLNGSGTVGLWSGNWRNTNAITSIKIYSNYNWVENTQFALYGIKA